MDYSPHQINYLDVLIAKDELSKTLRTSLYTKPTDTHQYLHAHILSPCRMKWICSEEEDLQHKLADLESWLVNRGYRAESVRREIQIVISIDRQVLLGKRPKIQEGSVTVVLTFHPALYISFDILKSAHQVIENSPTLKAILRKPPRVAFHNLKHYVINSFVQN